MVLFTTSASKVEDAKALGAAEVVVSTDEAQMKAIKGSFDLILDTVSAITTSTWLLGMIKRHGSVVLVKTPEDPLSVASFSLIFGGKPVRVADRRHRRAVLDFCAEHDIVSEVEMIKIDDLNEAYERLLKSDVKVRFVIDMESLS